MTSAGEWLGPVCLLACQAAGPPTRTPCMLGGRGTQAHLPYRAGLAGTHTAPRNLLALLSTASHEHPRASCAGLGWLRRALPQGDALPCLPRQTSYEHPHASCAGLALLMSMPHQVNTLPYLPKQTSHGRPHTPRVGPAPQARAPRRGGFLPRLPRPAPHRTFPRWT